MILSASRPDFRISKYRIVLLLTLLLLCACTSEPEATWHLVNVNATKLQGDANLIQTHNSVILIDGGYYSEAERFLIPYVSALGIKTIVLMVDTPLLYGSYSPKMIPVLPEGETNVTHNSLAKERIIPEEIYIKAKTVLNL